MNNHNHHVFMMRTLLAIFMVCMFLGLLGFLLLPWVYAQQNTSPLFVDLLIMSILFTIAAFAFGVAFAVESDV